MKTTLLHCAFLWLACLFLACGEVRAQTPSWHWISQQINEENSILPPKIATDRDGNVYTVVSVLGKLKFVNPTKEYYLHNNQYADIFIIKQNKCGDIVWVRVFGTTSHDEVKSMHIDNADNILITSNASNLEFTFDTQKLQIYPTNGGVLTKYNKNGNFVSCLPIHDARYPGAYKGIVTDNQNNVYISGAFGRLDINGVVYNSISIWTDACLVKYNTNGVAQWVRTFQTVNQDEAPFVSKVDADGNVYVLGQFETSLTLTGGTILNPTKKLQTYIAKYTSEGNLLWAKLFDYFPNDANSYTLVNFLDIDELGEVYITGNIWIGENLLSTQPAKMFFAKIDASGETQWKKIIDNPHTAQSMNIGNDGYIYFAGDLRVPHTNLFDDIPIPLNNGFPRYGAYIAKMSKIGKVEWVKTSDAVDLSWMNTAAFQNTQEMYIAGLSVVSTTNGNKYYPYLAKLSFINLDVPNITVCSKQVTQIGIVPQSNFTYSWLPTEGLSNPNIANPTVSLENNTDAPIVKQYIVKASDITCPNAPLVKYDTVKVTVLPAYDALKIFTGSTTVCPSTSGTKYWINANANYDITWNLFGGTIESGQSTDTIRVAWQNPNTNAWVEVKAKHKIYACETIFKLPIVIDNLLKPDKPTGESAFCIESDKVFTYKTSLLNNGSTYLWKTDDNTAIFVGANNQSEVKIRWTTAGIKKLWVVETNQTPCVGSSEILEINVLPIPAPIDIRGANLIPFFASQVRYEVQASTGSTYQWTLAQGGKITEGQGSPAIRIDWEQEGEYLLTVQETNAQGCVGKPSEMRIKVVPFLPPNVITPNGDGKNDTWFLDYIENFSAHKVQIIDRTGKEVYRSTVYKNDWDATGLPADVYFYYLTLHPRIKPMKGTITVIR